MLPQAQITKFHPLKTAQKQEERAFPNKKGLSGSGRTESMFDRRGTSKCLYIDVARRKFVTVFLKKFLIFFQNRPVYAKIEENKCIGYRFFPNFYPFFGPIWLILIQLRKFWSLR